LDTWDRLRLVSPRNDLGSPSYDFRDLIGLRTVKQLIENGVSANRLQRTVAALRDKLSQVHVPLAELRVLSDGKDVIVEREGARLEPLSGQFVLNFETRELHERVRVMAEPTADEWFARALQYEADRATRAQALDAYDRALRLDSQRLDALINCGTLYYEDRSLEKAAECFRRALALDSENALAHFNLGSVLEDLGDLEASRQHLRQAVRLLPDYCDAHYNLAFVCEKLGAVAEAQEHWQAYVSLDPVGPWCNYARQRLASFKSAKSAVTT
jgi:tetratricopeptide (TPR) repeat protein